MDHQKMDPSIGLKSRKKVDAFEIYLLVDAPPGGEGWSSEKS